MDEGGFYGPCCISQELLMFLMSYFLMEEEKMRPHPQLAQASTIPNFIKRDRSFPPRL